MNRIKPCSDFDNLSDIQLLEVMLTNDNAHSCIYLRHKTYCIDFMMSKGASENDALDIYQDATIVLYEKIRNTDFRLTSSIQTYLNSICYYQLLARGKSSYTKKIVLKDEVDENVQDWFADDDEIAQEKINKIRSALEDLKSKGDKCYERLNLFYYEKLKNEEIANRLGLQGATTVKNLINRCRNILKTMIGIK
jgi:RNA polymerase sigma factor (sigma-70 family)